MERSRNKDARSGDRTRDLMHQGRALTNCATLATVNRDPMVIAAGRSLVNKVNKIGPKTDPCGMPVVTGISITGV